MANNSPIKQFKKIISSKPYLFDYLNKNQNLEKGRLLFLSEFSFIAGSTNKYSLPEESSIEFAFSGRSNVGKSSLINSLTNQKKLAKTSQTPGRTQQLNFFQSKKFQLRLVDLPGFGYAKASKSSISSWQRNISSYLKTRSNLKRVFLLLDARRGIRDIDLEKMQTFDKIPISYQLVVTKFDKINIKDIESLVINLKKASDTRPALHPKIHITSSFLSLGIDELRTEIATIIEKQ